ncbi:MAG: ABC transporter permease [Chlamydiales bacterium]
MNQSYLQIVWEQFKKNKLGLIALITLAIFFLVGLYAPFLASSKPSFLLWNKKLYFPLFSYLFYSGFYTKPIDLFFNLLMFTAPAFLLGACLFKNPLKKYFLTVVLGLQVGLFVFFGFFKGIKDPASDPKLKQARFEALEKGTSFREDPLLSSLPLQTNWAFELQYMTPYEQLNHLLRHRQKQAQQKHLAPYISRYEENTHLPAPSLLNIENRNEVARRIQLKTILKNIEEKYQEGLNTLPQLMADYRPFSHLLIMAKYDLEHAPESDRLQAEKWYRKVLQEASPFQKPLEKVRQVILQHHETTSELNYLEERKQWLESEAQKLIVIIPPFIRPFHWEEDAGGAPAINQFVPWWELTRVNRKDLVASLIFGIRVSMIVGFTAIGLSLLIGLPLGMIAGYFGGKADLFICRLIEVWEAMPTFFMLLLVIAITQSKSILLVIIVLALFGWTNFARFIRAEMLKQRNLPYVLATKSLGFGESRIMFSHILPNAIPPILTLIPFAMMAAITSEAGLSFLGLGEEGSTSWGVLMDEGRSVFPSESYLLWPPAILLTILLVCIALVGDVIRDAIDPKMRG